METSFKYPYKTVGDFYLHPNLTHWINSIVGYDWSAYTILDKKTLQVVFMGGRKIKITNKGRIQQ